MVNELRNPSFSTTRLLQMWSILTLNLTKFLPNLWWNQNNNCIGKILRALITMTCQFGGDGYDVFDTCAQPLMGQRKVHPNKMYTWGTYDNGHLLTRMKGEVMTFLQHLAGTPSPPGCPVILQLTLKLFIIYKNTFCDSHMNATLLCDLWYNY
jgi:hypothetical protein